MESAIVIEFSKLAHTFGPFVVSYRPNYATMADFTPVI